MSEVADWFMLILERMARALGLALNKLFNLKQEGKLDEANQYISQYLQSEFDLNLTSFMDVENDEIITYLINKKFHSSHLETLAKIFTEYAETINDDEQQLNLYNKSEIIFNYINTIDKTFSLERQSYIKKINNQIILLNKAQQQQQQQQ